MDTETHGGAELDFLAQLAQASSRRTFLKWSGVTLAVSAIGCSDNTAPGADAVNLGTGDFAVLNYAYALEQLEAAFYIQVIAKQYTGATDAEKLLLTDIRDHEVIHRDFLKAALGAKAIADLKVTFASVNFADRNSVLTTARTFEDLGVSAYNGAGRLIVDPGYLLLAGKIVSVEARHAAAIRDLLQPKTAAFAGDDVVDPVSGLDGAKAPSKVLMAAGTYVTTKITSPLP